jgi:entericidin B
MDASWQVECYPTATQPPALWFPQPRALPRRRSRARVGTDLLRPAFDLQCNLLNEAMMTPFHILLLTAVLTLTACETVEGFGRDVRTTGTAITTEAQEAQ